MKRNREDESCRNRGHLAGSDKWPVGLPLHLTRCNMSLYRHGNETTVSRLLVVLCYMRKTNQDQLTAVGALVCGYFTTKPLTLTWVKTLYLLHPADRPFAASWAKFIHGSFKFRPFWFRIRVRGRKRGRSTTFGTGCSVMWFPNALYHKIIYGYVSDCHISFELSFNFKLNL